MTAGNVSSASDITMAMMNVRSGQGNIFPGVGNAASFQSLMSSTAGNQCKNDVAVKIKSDSNGSDDFKPKESIQPSKNSIDRITQSNDDKKLSTDSIDKAYADIKDVVKEELELTDEELDVMLSELGLNVADLLMPQNMAVLVATVNETDVTAIVTDEMLAGELNKLVTEVAQIVENTIENTGMDVADFADELIEYENGLAENEDFFETTPEHISETDDYDASSIVKDENTGKEIEVSVQDSRTEGAQSEATEVVAKTPENQKNDGEFNNNHESNDNSHGFAENIVQNLNQAVNDSFTSSVTFSESYTVNTSDVINQMMDAIRVNVTADTTSMEIQLTPENLGKISLNVASKDGAITATITAQNETVKAVIENQIVQLKESLNNQGLRVEHVEVTIASHGFSMNRENTSDNGNQDSGHRTRRRFRSDDEISENNVTMDEIMEQQIMEANGNSVSYTA